MLENILNSIKEKARKLRPIASAAVLASSLFLPAGVKAVTNRVPSQYSTIQQAVDNSINGDTVLVADGTYSVPVTNGITWNASEKHLTIKSENGPDNCIIDCQSKGRAFTLNSGQTTNDMVYGITMQNGKSFWVTTGEATKIWGGGGVFVNAGSPQIKSCVIQNCQAVQSPRSPSYADGGAIDIIGPGASPIISDCMIVSNQATHTGGGIHVYNATPIIKNNIIKKNHNGGCYGGGGIGYTYNSGGEVNNNLIAENTAHYYATKGGFGGGIEMMNSNPTISFNTIVSNCTYLNGSTNYPGEGGGIRVRGLPAAIIKNNILYGNLSTNGLEDLDFQYPTLTLDINYSLIGSGSTNFICPDRESNLWFADPNFVNSADRDYHLSPGSPCIDAGADIANIVEDIEHNPRNLDGNTDGHIAPDMGCYEFLGGDTDRDSQSDNDELVAGTDYTNNADSFAVKSPAYDSGLGNIVISWDTKTNRLYTLSSSQSLGQGSWSNVQNYTEIPGTGSAMSYTNSSPDIRGYFRVNVRKDN